MELPQVTHDAPIAGQSLTAEVGNRPWQNPPQFAEVDDAINFYVPKLLDPTFSNQLLDVIEMGVPLTTIANSLQISGVMQGLHSIDLGVLVSPIIVELMKIAANAEEVEYNNDYEDKEQVEEDLNRNAIQLAALKVEEKMDAKEEKQNEEEKEVVEQVKGLLARRT